MAQIQTGQNLEDHHDVVLEVELERLHPAASASATSATDEHVEEATCRICLDESSEGEETLLLECSCRGELALVHRACAIEWFSRKGDNSCDVCHEIIPNIPMDLLRISETNTTGGGQTTQGANWGMFRVCQEAPELVVANAFAYLVFLLKFLAKDMGDVSVVISLLLSGILGYLSAVTSTTMARGRYVWLYAVVQFSSVFISTYMLRLLVKLNVEPMVIVVSATFVGFGVALCGGSMVVGALWLRARWIQQHQQAANANNN